MALTLLRHAVIASVLLSALSVLARAQNPGEGVQPSAHLPTVPPVQVQNPFQPFDQPRFEKAARELGATELQVKTFAEDVAEIGAARAADDLLRKAVPAFDAAVLAAQEGDPQAALSLAKVLVETKSPLLQAHVRYHIARLFLALAHFQFSIGQVTFTLKSL